MPSLALTGNIGSGKTEALDLLVSLLAESGTPVLRFSADEENRRLLGNDPEVAQLIRSQLGAEYCTLEGSPDREKIGRLIASDQQAKEDLETIMHPRLENIWKPMAETHRFPSCTFFVAEIPLLYEKGLVRFFDKVLAVACSNTLRRERLLSSRSVTPERAAGWLALQKPQNEKISQADHLIWNDGSVASLEKQLQRFLRDFTTS